MSTICGECDKIGNQNNSFENRFNKPFLSTFFFAHELTPLITFVCMPKQMSVWKHKYEARKAEHASNNDNGNAKRDSWSFTIRDIIDAKGEIIDFNTNLFIRERMSFHEDVWNALKNQTQLVYWKRILEELELPVDSPMDKNTIQIVRDMKFPNLRETKSTKSKRP